MAINTDAPRGFYPLSADAEINKFSPNLGYLMTASETVYQGDVVKTVADGTVEVGEAGIGTAAIGIAAETKTAAASGDYRLKVYDDPTTNFGVQSDSGTALTQAAVGNTADHVAGAGNALTKLSGHELDADDVGSGAQFKILALIDSPDNVWGEEHSEVRVRFNEHHYSAAVAGV